MDTMEKRCHDGVLKGKSQHGYKVLKETEHDFKGISDMAVMPWQISFKSCLIYVW